jgi:uncharacterized protein (TIRG00374 family)
MKKKVARLMMLLGFALLVLIIVTIGPVKIWHNIKRISLVNFMILVGLRLMYWLLRTVNWKVVLNVYDHHIGFYELFRARMIGHAVSQLTPTAQVGGEASRIMALRGVSKKLSVSSVIIEKTIEFLSAVFFTLIAMAALFARFSLSVKTKVFFIGAVTLAALLVIFLQLKQRQGLLSWMMRIISRFKIGRGLINRNREKIAETDRYISDFYLFHKTTFLMTFFLFGLLTLLWVTEVHLNLIYLGANVTLGESFLITTLGSLSMIFPFIPASLGIYEVTYAGLFVILGLDAGLGVTLVMIRRIIALVMAGVGLLAMVFSKRGKGPVSASGQKGGLSGFIFAQAKKNNQPDQNDNDNCAQSRQDEYIHPAD